MKKTEKEKKVNLFTFIDQICNKRKTVPYDQKIASAYMLTYILSFDKSLSDIVNKMNKYQFLLSQEAIYNYYMSEVPIGRRYIGFKKKKETEKLDKYIEQLKKKYPNMSKREAKIYISYLKNQRRSK